MSKPWVTHASEEFAAQYVPGNGVVCISIQGPEQDREALGLSRNFESMLEVDFDDVLEDTYGYVTINEKQAEEIASFLTRHRGKHIFVHCAAGISRSGAVAEVVLEAFPEYHDRGWSLTGETSTRHANTTVKRMLKRAMGMTPYGVAV